MEGSQWNSGMQQNKGNSWELTRPLRLTCSSANMVLGLLLYRGQRLQLLLSAHGEIFAFMGLKRRHIAFEMI